MDNMDRVAKLAKSFAQKSGEKERNNQIPKIPASPKISMNGEKFNVGFAMRDITPSDLTSHVYWMAGYRIAKRITGFLDPLTMSAMWIDCGDSQGMVLLSCDLIGLTGYENRVIKSKLKNFCKDTGCKNITISCTHTHAGIDTMGYWGPLPKTGKDKAFMQTVIDTAVELCYLSYANRKSGSLYYGTISAPELTHRWRQPYFQTDTLHRFRFVPDDGSTETWYLNFPAHPNTMGGKNKMLSADYPCYMRREINREKKVNVLFAVGAIGATDIGEVADDDTERTILGGMLLGKKACEIKDERELKPNITVIEQKFVLPIDNPVYIVANKMRVFSSIKCKAQSETGLGLVSSITYIGIDGAQILTMPGEMFQELVYSGGYCDSETSSTGEGAEINPTPLCEIFGDDDLMIFGVTNDMAGYALAPNDFVLHKTQPFISRATDRFGRNHYHETNSCGIKTGEVIANTCKIIKDTLDK